MELRKVQSLTSGSMYVTLPKVWTKRTNLQPGNMVRFSPLVDGSLALQPFVEADEALTEDEILVITVNDQMSDNQLKDHLRRAYAMGHRRIRLETSKPLVNGQLRAITEVQNTLMGMAVLEEERDHQLLQVSLDVERFNLHQLLGRIIKVLGSMIELAFELPSAPQTPTRPDQKALEKDMEQVYWLSLRYFFHAQEQMVRGLFQAPVTPHMMMEISHIIKRCYQLHKLISSLVATRARLPAPGHDRILRVRMEQALQIQRENHELLSRGLDELRRKRVRPVPQLEANLKEVEAKLTRFNESLLGGAEGGTLLTMSLQISNLLTGYLELTEHVNDILRNGAADPGG